MNIINRADGSLFVRAAEAALASNGKALWLEPNISQAEPKEIWDVAALVLNDQIEDFAEVSERIVSMPATMLVTPAERQEDWRAEHAYPRVGADVFILGFPKGLVSQGVFPVWKRGSIATEPLFFALNNKPVFLVDAATKDGMSGSPVIYLGSDLTDDEGRPAGNMQDTAWLVGIYAGRQGVTREEVDMVLGRVWRREVLDSIFWTQIPGLSQLDLLLA